MIKFIFILFIQRKPYKGLTDNISFDENGYNNKTVFDVSTMEIMPNGSTLEVIQTTWTPHKIFIYAEKKLFPIFKNKTLVLGAKVVSRIIQIN